MFVVLEREREREICCFDVNNFMKLIVVVKFLCYISFINGIFIKIYWYLINLFINYYYFYYL